MPKGIPAKDVTPEARLERIRSYKRKWALKEKTDPRLIELRLQNRLRNKPHKLAYNKARRIKHRARVLALEKQYRENNRVALREAQRRFRARHPDRSAKFAKLFRAANPEKCREWGRKWRQANPDKVRDRVLRRRARLAGATVEDCSEKIKLLKRERFCHWCCTPLTPETVSIDHVLPIARGGEHKSDNLVATCRFCNYSRADKLISEWTWKEAA